MVRAEARSIIKGSDIWTPSPVLRSSIVSRPVGFLFLVSLALGTAAVAAAESPVACRFTEAEIEIDGRVNEQAWKHAQAIDGLLVVGGERHGSPPEQDTRVRLLWDRGALYVAAECAGSPHSDDAVALVLRPRGDHPQHYSIRVTADNVVEARLDGDEVASAAAPGRFWIESATERAAIVRAAMRHLLGGGSAATATR